MPMPLTNPFDAEPFDVQHRLQLARMMQASDSLVDSLSLMLDQVQLECARKFMGADDGLEYAQGKIAGVDAIRSRLREILQMPLTP